MLGVKFRNLFYFKDVVLNHILEGKYYHKSKQTEAGQFNFATCFTSKISSKGNV